MLDKSILKELQGGVVMQLTRMNRILEIDAPTLTATVEPGVITQQLHNAVEGRGLFYPHDPASASVYTIGGNVATCAGGLRGLKYGVTRNYALGTFTKIDCYKTADPGEYLGNRTQSSLPYKPFILP